MFTFWLITYTDRNKSNFIVQATSANTIFDVTDYVDTYWNKGFTVIRLYGSEAEIKKMFPYMTIRSAVGII